MTEELRELLLSDNHEDNLLGVNIMRAKKMNVKYWLRKISTQEGYTFFNRYFEGYPSSFTTTKWRKWAYNLKDEFTNN